MGVAKDFDSVSTYLLFAVEWVVKKLTITISKQHPQSVEWDCFKTHYIALFMFRIILGFPRAC